MIHPDHYLENRVELYFVKRAKAAGGFVRKVVWLGHRSAPDRLFVYHGVLVWIELKKPGRARTFPASELERAQFREHERMRKHGLRVEVIDSEEQVNALIDEVIGVLW